MPPLTDSRLLNSSRLQQIVETRASDLERMRKLTFIDRLTSVEASDDEIMGRFTAKQLTADIVADDQKALVYESGAVELVTTVLPNIKIGQHVSQAQLNLLSKIRDNPRAEGQDALFDWEWRFGTALVQAVRERMNMLACAMMIDALSYNRFGLQFSGLTWGMPANLKVTVSPLWSTDAGATANAANARPIRDILNMDRVAADNYGDPAFNRITMSTQAFDIMTQATEFRDRANLFTGLNFTLGTNMLALEDRDKMANLAGRILGKEIVIDDKTFRTAANAGTTSTTRVLPANKVLLDRTDNGPTDWDWGNAIVTESVVAELLDAPIIGENAKLLSGGSFGPLAYYTPRSFDANPPGANGWAVARGFPRKHVREASAVLTVW